MSFGVSVLLVLDVWLLLFCLLQPSAAFAVTVLSVRLSVTLEYCIENHIS